MHPHRDGPTPAFAAFVLAGVLAGIALAWWLG